MTKNCVYGIYDEALESYLMPLHFVNDKLAIRTMSSAFKEKRLNVPELYSYPNNFHMDKIGLFDDRTGVYDSIKPEIILRFDSVDIDS